jgi:hypothetical protein
MNIVASSDPMISRLDAFKTTAKAGQVSSDDGQFAKSLSDATLRLYAGLAEDVPLGPVMEEVAAISPRAEAFSLASYRSQDWLMDTEAQSSAARPNMREFMDVTGVDSVDASELLYGVIGSNADLRDWSKIMASGNPVDAARAATGQMYNSNKEYALVKHQDYGQLTFAETLAQSSLSSKTVVQELGNFATIEADGGSQQTMAVSSTGLILRGAGSTQAQIERTAWLFGLDASALFGDS